MVNPQMEMLGATKADSTEVGRIVPIYEAIGTFGSRSIRRAIYAALQLLDPRMPEVLAGALRTRLGIPVARARRSRTRIFRRRANRSTR